MSNQDDAVTFLKNACNSEIPKELEMQLKSGSMKISLQSKPKTDSSLPGFIMKKIPGPAIEPSKAVMPGQVLGKITKTVTLKYDSQITKGLNTSSVNKNGNIDAFKQFRDIDVQLISGQKKQNNSSLQGLGIKRRGDIITPQNVKFTKISPPVSAGGSTDGNSKSISDKASFKEMRPMTKASNSVIPRSLLNSKDVVCKLVRKTDAANVSVNSESNKNIELFKRVNLNRHSIGQKSKTDVQKEPQNQHIQKATASIFEKVTVGSVNISTKIIQHSKPPTNIKDLNTDSRQQTTNKRQTYHEPFMVPRSKIQKTDQPVSTTSANVTAHQVNMGKSFSRFDLKNKQTENQQRPRFRKIYPRFMLSRKPDSSAAFPKNADTDAQSTDSVNNFDQECPEQCGEKFSNVGDLVTHYQEAHETPNCVDQSLDEQSEPQQNVIDDFVKALNEPFIIEGKKDDSKSEPNADVETPSTTAPACNPSSLLGVWWKPLLPMLEYFPAENLKNKKETPETENCQDKMKFKQELQEYEYDENDDTEECEVLSDVEEEDLTDRFDDFAESLAEACGETDYNESHSLATDSRNMNSGQEFSKIEQAVEEIYNDSSDKVVSIEISDSEDEGSQDNEILQLENFDDDNIACAVATQSKDGKRQTVSIKYYLDEDTKEIRDIQRVKLVYWNDSNTPDIKDLDLCLVVRKSLDTITTVLDEDISDGIISDYGVIRDSFICDEQAVIQTEEIISLSDDEDSSVRESTEEASCSPLSSEFSHPEIISISDDEDDVDVFIPSKTVVITKIRNTVHTPGISSFSMSRHLTQTSDGIPKQTQRQDQALLPSSTAFGQLNRRSQDDYDSDEEYDRLNFGVPDDEDVANEAPEIENKSNHVLEDKAENKDTKAEHLTVMKATDAVENPRKQNEPLKSCNVKIQKLNKMSLIKTCFVRVEKITIPAEELPQSEDSEEDLDEDFEDELDRVFAEIEALEKKQAQGETKIETKNIAISDILDCLIGNVMGEVVKPWSKYVTVKKVVGKADKTFSQRKNDTCDSVIAPSQLESGWDRMEITSQPAESMTPLNYYFTC